MIYVWPWLALIAGVYLWTWNAEQPDGPLRGFVSLFLLVASVVAAALALVWILS